MSKKKFRKQKCIAVLALAGVMAFGSMTAFAGEAPALSDIQEDTGDSGENGILNAVESTEPEAGETEPEQAETAQTSGEEELSETVRNPGEEELLETARNPEEAELSETVQNPGEEELSKTVRNPEEAELPETAPITGEMAKVSGSKESTEGQKKIADECVLEDASGIKFVVEANETNEQLLSNFQMKTAKYDSEEDFAYVRENIEPLGEIRAYSVTIEATDAAPEDFMAQFEGSVPKMYVPVPEGWDVERTGLFVKYTNEYGSYIYEQPSEGSGEDGRYLIFIPDGFYKAFHAKTVIFGIFQKSSASEAKLWKNDTLEFIRNLRYVNWFSGVKFDDHYFKDTASANDVGYLTMLMENHYNDHPEYITDVGYIMNIPYDVLASDAEKYFKNIPDLKQADMKNCFYYDAEKNVFVVQDMGAGDMDPVVEVARVDELGSDTYAIRFVFKDYPDEPTYESEATLVVEDNGHGGWRYLSFLKGYPELDLVEPDPSEPNPSEPEPSEPVPSGPDKTPVNPNEGEDLSETPDVLKQDQEKPKTESTTGNGSAAANGKESSAPKTSDVYSTYFYIVMILLAGGAVVFLVRRRNV